MVLLRFIFDSLMIRREAHMTRSRMQALQLKRFRKLAAFAAENSPYYAQIIRDYGITVATCHPEDFPILTKDQVIEHFDSIVTDPRITKELVIDFLERSHNPQDKLLDTYYAVRTSGTSGTIGYYLYKEAEVIRGVSPIILAAGNFQLRQRLAYIAVTKDHYAGVTMATMARKLPLLYESFQAFDINEPFDQIVTQLNRMQPTAVSGYALSIKKLAEAQSAGHLSIAPRVIQSGGEPLADKDKEYIQQIFKASVTNVYAASEHMVMGIGRDDLQGMFVIDSNIICEPHATHTLVTNLYNYTLPLIRYKMTDVLQLKSDRQPLLEFHEVVNVVGRHEYSPVFVNQRGEEDFISSHLLDFSIRGVRRKQIHVLSKRAFSCKVCFDPGLHKQEKEQALQLVNKRLHSILSEKLMDNVVFTVDVVEDLPINPTTGKFQLVVKDKHI